MPSCPPPDLFLENIKPLKVSFFHFETDKKIFTILGFYLFIHFQSDVIRTKNTECLSFPLVFANLLIAILWTTYGRLIQDVYVAVSILGLIGYFKAFFQSFQATKSIIAIKHGILIHKHLLDPSRSVKTFSFQARVSTPS